MISAVGGFSYYLFYTNFDKAFMYYDEILQEKNEEVIQFGELKEPERNKPENPFKNKPDAQSQLESMVAFWNVRK